MPYSESVKGKAEIKRRERMAKQLTLQEAKKDKAGKTKQAESKGSGKAEQPPVQVVEDLRGKQSLYITSMKNKVKNKTITENEKVVLDLYNSLARTSAEKGVLVQKWLQDHSCQLATSYTAEKMSKKVTASSSVSGWGTKLEP